MTDEMWKALYEWQTKMGYMWKSKLTRAWMKNEDVGEELLRVRNVIGHGGLYKIDLGAPKE